MDNSNMKQITLKSNDIHCDACANSIVNTVGKVIGVENVAVDVDSQTATVYFDSPATEQQVREAMTDAGFDIEEDN